MSGSMPLPGDGDPHRDHALALALRSRSDPAPITDLAARARKRAEADAAGLAQRLARGRRILRWIEAGACAVIVVLVAVGLATWDGQTAIGATPASSDSSDPWLEARWIASAACVAAIAYAVIARAEPLAAVKTASRQTAV